MVLTLAQDELDSACEPGGQRRIAGKSGDDVKAERADDSGRWSSEELPLRAAWYYCNDELTQDEIARRLSMSRASVGRLLDRARRVGLGGAQFMSTHLFDTQAERMTVS
jgi:hypothetical protein